MGYRVVLLKNGEYKKTMHRCQKRDTAFINYRGYKKQNESVIFPRRFINYNGIVKVKYEILVVKDIEDTDKNRFVRDYKGRLYEEQPLGGIWTIIDSSEYNLEEKFWVFGHNSKSDRLTIGAILKKLMKGAYKQKMVKQILVVHNKLIIHNEDEFEMVVCKNKEDCQRLHHALAKAAKKSRIKSLLFLGTASPATISRMYETIHEETGWPYTKIRRTSTRP
jgi:hypothetical protein